ncbi:hypothetical protein FACS1894204_13790 [Synergistales bacterium]|nr:hypothetical protein FACS1894204_13790 [Synergistales bacterium]
MNFERSGQREKEKKEDKDARKNLRGQEIAETTEFTEITVNELLSAISETEYPSYIIDAIAKIQAWLLDTVNAPSDKGMDPVTAMFESEGSDMDLERLFTDMESLEEYVDIIPNTKRPHGRPDAVVVSIDPPDYESGVRTAIDYAALFNRANCKRVWVLSDTFAFWDTVHYAAHVNALAEQGVTVRYILITPYGWVEMPLSDSSSSNRSLLWNQA